MVKYYIQGEVYFIWGGICMNEDLKKKLLMKLEQKDEKGRLMHLKKKRLKENVLENS